MTKHWSERSLKEPVLKDYQKEVFEALKKAEQDREEMNKTFRKTLENEE